MKKNKIVVGLFTLLIMLLSACFIQPGGSEAKASGNSNAFHVEQSLDISAYKIKNDDGIIISTIPKASGEYKDWIFAGWYKDIDCTSAVGKNTVQGTYHAKFVPAEVLSIKCQTNTGIKSTADTAKIRIISTVDSVKYSQVGFDLQFKGKELSYQTSTVLSGIQAAKDGVEYGFSPNIFDLQSKYFITATIVNIPNKDFDEGLLMKPYWVTKDGTKVYGVERYARVEDSYLNIVNVPVRLVSDNVQAQSGTVTVTYDNAKLQFASSYTGTIKDDVQTTTPGFVTGGAFTVEAAAGTEGTVTVTGSADTMQSTDGMFAHLRFQALDANGVLPKTNIFKVAAAFTDAEEADVTGVAAVKSVYHYYNTTYTGNADEEWFDGEHVAEGTTEFVITSPDELYGLAKLVNDGKFTTQKVYLGADITVNGKVLDNEGALVTDTSNLKSWTPIGQSSGWANEGNQFIGSFDGQNHTVRGLYTDKSSSTTNSHTDWYVGLFGTVRTNYEIKNIKVVDSFFKCKNYAGGVVGRINNGKIDNVYSEANVWTTESGAGGIVGCIVGKGTISVNNAWFKGKATTNGQFCGGIVGASGVSGNSTATITISNCLNEGSVIGGSKLGGLVGRAVDVETFIKDCLNIGTVNGTAAGSVVGDSSAKPCRIEDVYALTSGAVVGNGSLTGEAVATFTNANKNTYYGYKALDVLRDKWDFDNTWVVRANNTPVLKAWCESGALYTPATTWAGGTGTEKDPYIIKTASQLYKLANDVNNGEPYDNTFFKLGANITVNSGTASAWETNAPKYNWITIGKQNNQHFKGSLDGANYTIKGLYIVDTSTAVGLFVDPDEVVLENLKVTNSYLKGGTGTAAVVGWYGGGTFDSIYSDAIVVSTGAHGAGLVSLVDQADTTFTNCWFDGSLTTGDFSGGIVSCNTKNIQLTNCLNTGSVTSSGSTGQVGGIIGRAAGAVVMSDCLNTGKISGLKDTASIIGFNNYVTINVERVYALESSHELTCANDANVRTKVDEVTDVTGGNGYLNTYLSFDRPELPVPTTGEWVARKNNVPALKSLVSASDILPLDGNNMYRADTRWHQNPTVDEQGRKTYTIQTVEELVGFAKLVNDGTNFAGEVVSLGADITVNSETINSSTNKANVYQWTPIGTKGKKFSGTFDGQGHTLTGLYSDISNATDGTATSGYWYAGLFGTVNTTASIKDFSIKNSYFKANHYAGSVAGLLEAGTIENVYSEAIIETRLSGAGGIVGQITGIGPSSISRAWFKGTSTAGSYVSGGIVGASGSRSASEAIQLADCLNEGGIYGPKWLGGLVGNVVDIEIKITDCLNTGEVHSKTESGAAIGRIVSTCTSENVYAIGSLNAVGVGSAEISVLTNQSDLSGAKGYLNTYLTFERPELPVPTTGAWVVRKNAVPGLKSFVNADDILTLNGSNMYRADTRWHNNPVVDENDVKTYTIKTAEELIGFAKLVNEGTSFTGEVVCLGADITVNAKTMNSSTSKEDVYQWTPIGSKGKKFSGTFDGKGFTISGLYSDINNTTDANNTNYWYAGLFGTVNTAAFIKDFSIKNSYFKATHYAGSVVGLLEAGTIDSVYSEANVETGQTGAGGIVGSVKGVGACTVQNIWFKGTVTASSLVCGGIVGASGSPNAKTAQIVININNCLNEGVIKGTQWVGGLVGRIVDSETDITDCINVGTVTGTKEVGNAIGTIGSTCKTTNVYVLTSNNPAVGSGTVSGTAPTVCDDLNNYKGYMNTNLDFDHTWVAMENSAPVLQNFAPEEGKFDTTSWYVKAGNDVGTSEENPYPLDSVADMYGFAKRANASTDGFAGKYFKLTSSVSFNEGNPTDGNWATTAPYYVWTPIGSATANFKGHFDGGSHTISGLYVKNAASANDKKLWYVGLFGYVDGAEIKNVSVKDSYFYASYYAASIVGWLQNGTLSNVYSNSTIQVASGHGGGIAGALSNATIQNAWFEGSVTGGSFVGGIVGFINDQSGRVSSCLSDGTIAGSQSGGIIGRVAGQTTIDNCLSVSNVTGGNAGALVGYHYDCELTINSSFGLKSGAQVTVNTSNEANGNPTGNATDTSVKANSLITNREHLYDTGAYGFQQEQFDENQELTGNKWVSRLDYTKWTARIGDIPVPAVFEVADGYQVDTSWYDVEEAGTMENPYLIKDVADFYGFAILSQTKDFTGKVISLENNLIINKDANAQTAKLYEWIPIGDRETPFAGTFLGNGYTITGLYKTFKAWERLAWIGMFEMTADTSVISNFNIKNTYFAYTGTSNATRIGSVAGEGYGTFDSIYSDATLKSGGVGVGGILGVVCNADSRANITNCWYAGEIISTRSKDCYLGGIVGFLYNGSEVVVSHSLYSGSITTDGTRVGGICGNVENGTLTSTDNLITGKLSGKEHVGIVVGRAKTIPEGSATLHINTTWGVNDYAAYDVGSQGTDTEAPIISGKAHISTSKDRFIGMIPEYNSITGVEETLASQKAEGEETGFDGWVMIKDGTPVLKSFVKEGGIKTPADVYEYATVVSALNPNDDYASWFANTPEHKGDGTYQYVIEQQTNARYTAYCNALSSGAFELYSSNTVEGDGVSNHIFTAKNDDLVVNVTFVPTNTIYITVSTGQPLSEYLKGVAVNADEQNVATDAYTLVGDEQLENVTFHMLEQTADMNGVANSFVIRKKNGHFILIDGGVDLQAPYLFEYLESLVLEDGKKPVIDAWVISHGHYDHFGVFKTIWNDSFATGDAKKNYAGQVYVNGIYFNEPNSALWTQYNSNDLQFLGYMKRAVPLFKTSTGNTPSIYRMQTGQGYTFGDVTMDVMLSQELLTAEDYSWANTKTGGAFNETSTWTMFTINNKKVLTAGDGEEKSKDRIVEMYSKNYMNVDVFTALHHGINMNTIVTTVLGNVVNWNDDFTDHINVNSVVLYSRRNDIMEDTAPEDKNNRAKKNKAFLDEMTDLGVVTKYADGTTSTSGNHPKYFYYGQGTSVLTFGDTITAELKTRISE